MFAVNSSGKAWKAIYLGVLSEAVFTLRTTRYSKVGMTTNKSTTTTSKPIALVSFRRNDASDCLAANP